MVLNPYGRPCSCGSPGCWETEIGEHATVTTIIEPIRRQEPGHYAFYQMQSRALWDRLAPWQKWLTRRLRALSFTPGPTSSGWATWGG